MTHRLAVSLVLALTTPACLDAAPDENTSEITSDLTASDAAQRAQIALRWAPVHYQDVDQTGSHALGGAADYLTTYDYDGNLNGRDNWDHAGNAAYPLRGAVYYSVTETSTHWYAVYLFFHPRDWSDSLFDTEHENDAEGALFAIQRDGSTYGKLQAAITVAHKDFFSFTPTGSTWASGGESVDGTLSLETLSDGGHPQTAQEAKGHGCKAKPYVDINGDGVVYYPTLGAGEVPDGPNDRSVKYQLIDINAAGGMWDQRNNTTLFASFGSFAGDNSDGCGSGTIGCDTNAANTPWGWDDHDDVPGRGALASDPATVVKDYFKIPEAVSTTYTYNPFK